MAPAANRAAMVSRHLSASAPTAADPAAKIAPDASEPVVLFETVNALRKMTLNRPKKLNTLNDEMVSLIAPQIKKWEESDLANVVLFKGNGKSFCAGGDVATLVGQLSDPATWTKSAAFFEKEYAVDAYIAKMKTPVVTFMTGNTLGGGVGLAIHAPFRIATETTKIAMPETKIGLFPDVGVNFFLSRMDGQLGLYLALTSETVAGVGAFLSGFATHYVPSERLAALEERLGELSSTATMDQVNSAIEEFVGDATEFSAGKYGLIGPTRRAIDLVFAGPTAEKIVSDLQAIGEGTFKKIDKVLLKGEESQEAGLKAWATETARLIERRSPTSVKLAMMMNREGKSLDIDNAFRLDMRVGAACCNPELHPDFVTGVNHVVINKGTDKPSDPIAAWNPSSLSAVSESSVQKLFFSNPPPFKNPPLPSVALTHPGASYKAYPHTRFALPSEEDVKAVVTGEAKGSDGYALTAEEVVKKLVKARGGKIGVKEKVQEVLARRCKVGQEGTLKWTY